MHKKTFGLFVINLLTPGRQKKRLKQMEKHPQFFDRMTQQFFLSKFINACNSNSKINKLCYRIG